MASRLTRDQNLSVHLDAAAGVKTQGGRAVSNSGKPSALKPSRKHNVVPIREDLGVPKKAQIPSSQKQQGLKTKTQGKQQSVVFSDDEKLPFSIAEEGFLHNHHECIKSQKKQMDFNEFLKIIGLDESVEDACFESVSACNNPPRRTSSKAMMMFEMEMISERVIEDQPCGGLASPISGSPSSPKMSVKDFEDFPIFMLTE